MSRQCRHGHTQPGRAGVGDDEGCGGHLRRDRWQVDGLGSWGHRDRLAALGSPGTGADDDSPFPGADQRGDRGGVVVPH